MSVVIGYRENSKNKEIKTLKSDVQFSKMRVRAAARAHANCQTSLLESMMRSTVVSIGMPVAFDSEGIWESVSAGKWKQQKGEIKTR